MGRTCGITFSDFLSYTILHLHIRNEGNVAATTFTTIPTTGEQVVTPGLSTLVITGTV